MPIIPNSNSLAAAKAAYATMSATPSAPTQTDDKLLASPNLLFGDAILSLAERYSDKQIADKVTANATAGGKTYATSQGAIEQRVKGALAKRAEIQARPLADVKAEHDALRFASGVKSAKSRDNGVKNQRTQAEKKAVAAGALSAEKVASSPEGQGEENGEEGEENGGEEGDFFVDSSRA